MSIEVKFACPQCGQHLSHDGSWGGRMMQCPACNTSFTVPSGPEAGSMPQRPHVASAGDRRPLRETMTPPAVPPRERSATSGLAIASLACSLGTLIVPVGFVAGIVCGHLAKAQIRKNPGMGGKGLATAGLVIGYGLPAVALAFVIVFFGWFFTTARRVAQEGVGTVQMEESSDTTTGVGDKQAEAARSAGGSLEGLPAEPWRIGLRNADIPKVPASGTIAGEKFVVRRARLMGNDLVLSGDPVAELPEFRISSSQGFVPTFPEALERAVQFGVHTLLFGNGSLPSNYSIRFRSKSREVSFKDQAGLRLALMAPQGLRSHGSIHFGCSAKEKSYLLGEFELEISPELAESLKKIKPLVPEFNRRPAKR